MIIIFNSQATKDNVQELIADIHAKGLKTHLSEGDNTTIVGVIGDTTRIDIDNIKSASYIADVKRVSEPLIRKALRRC